LTSLGLALEPLLEIRVRRDVLGEDFDGDGAVQAGVTGLVDFSHATGAERGAGSGGMVVGGNPLEQILGDRLNRRRSG